jgi:hypothetical protein
MTFLFLLSFINLICFINIFLLIDLFILLIAFLNLASISLQANTPTYNYLTGLIVWFINIFTSYLPIKGTIDIIKWDETQNSYYVESKDFFWIMLKMLFVINSAAFIVLVISLIPFFI